LWSTRIRELGLKTEPTWDPRKINNDESGELEVLKLHSKKLGEVAILHLRGGIVTGQTNVLHNAVLSHPNAGVVVLDLARVTGVDAHGLGVLLELREQTQSKGIEFRLMNVTRLVLQVLEITSLNTIFEFWSEAEVLSKALHVRPATAVVTSIRLEA
jgi:anti-anti-sigma factor